MWLKILFLFIVASTATAINIRKIVGENPNLQKCIPTLDMVDASGKMPSGMLSGNLFEFGAFDQCLQIEHHNNQTGETKQGKYCIVKINLPIEGPTGAEQNEFFIDASTEEIEERMVLTMSGGGPGISLGWCVPHNCPMGELTKAITKFFDKVAPGFKMELPAGGLCQTKEDLETNFSTNDIAIIAFLSTTGFIMIMSTLYDMYCHYNKKKVAHIMLTAFSVLTNGKKLLAVSQNPDQLGCLNGLRVISMMWVLLGHKYIGAMVDPNINTAAILTWKQDPKNMFMLNASFSVDTFLLLSGLLVSYVFCLQMDKGMKFNIISYYIHRYLRLTPVLAVVMWLQASIVTQVGNGPLWPMTEFYKQNCVDNWWANLLYIQNYYLPSINMCLGQSWYLSVDMHLYILSPILLIPLRKWPKYTMYSMALLLLASMAIPFTITYLNDPPAAVEAGNADPYGTYQPTHARYGPWLMGIMLGYYLFTLRKTRHNRIKLHPAQITFGWLVGLGLLGGTLYGPYDVTTKGGTILENSFLVGFSRHGWSLGVCWVIYACTQGYGGPINAFLSWSAFQVLGRFSYTLYLVHSIVLLVVISSLRTMKYFSNIQMMYSFWSDFVASLVFAIALTLAYESPILTIEKVLFGKGKDNKKKIDGPEPGHTKKGFEEA